MTDLQTRLQNMEACSNAIEWVGDRTLEQAWNECPRADWLLWFAARLKIDHKLLVLTACACARTALQYVVESEERPRLAIETVERWVHGEATIDEAKSAARVAARADVYTTHTSAAAYTAHAYAVRAASRAAYAARAAVAYAAAYAVAAHAAIHTDADADAAAVEMADLVRSMIPFEMIVER